MRRWQLFLGIELALTLWLFFQIITNPMALTTILVGVFFLFLGARWHRLRSFNVAFGGILLVLGIFINPAIWLILMIAGVFIIMVVTKPGMGFSAWDRKQYVAPVTQEPSEKAGKRTINSWTDRHTISPTYDWDDINMVVPAGDTIIDLGDTFLPKGDSVIMIRKGFGKNANSGADWRWCLRLNTLPFMVPCILKIKIRCCIAKVSRHIQRTMMMHRAAFTSLRVWVSVIWRCWLYEKTDAGWLFYGITGLGAFGRGLFGFHAS
ncbi:Predicted membrane protein [Lacticaseibacillus paracasei ATCC 334]|uniref:Predicted membrane protein n=2 Tax=Lacticaseibacillus paracasei TaxID=1597 RepID=Q038D2_LACP3|nr:Predicted membrane protein [Lacticaseibacillus paracasei ATCC 334]